MDIQELKVFLHLSQSLHFKKTSEVFHTSPSTLSRIIQRLETEFDQTFFERDNRRVSLTAAGIRFVEFAESVITHWRRLKNDLEVSSQILSGELTIYCTVTAAHLYLPELLEKFRALHPKVEIKLETGDVSFAYQKVAQGEADFAFAVAPDKLPDKFQFQHLHHIPFKLIAPKQPTHFSNAIKNSHIEWKKLPFVMPESGPAAERLKDWLRKMQIKPKIYAHVSGHEAIVSMTALGCGVSAVPLPVLENSPVRDKVKILPVTFSPKPFDLGIIGLKKRFNSLIIKAFWSIVLENASQ